MASGVLLGAMRNDDNDRQITSTSKPQEQKASKYKHIMIKMSSFSQCRSTKAS